MVLGRSASSPIGLSINTSSANSLFNASSTTPAAGMFGNTQASKPTTGVGASNTAAPAGGLFGSTATTSAPSSGLFGSIATSSAPAGGLFGSTAPQIGGLSGSTQPQQSGGLIGNTTTLQPAQTSNLFGSINTSQPAQTSNLFGSIKSSQPAQTSNLFGSTNTSQPGQTGGLFRSTNTSQPAQMGGLFGSTNTSQPAQTGALFGSANGISQPQQSGGLFGTSTTAQPAQTGGIFGGLNTQNQNKPATSSIFGLGNNQNQQAQPQQSSLFSTLNQPQQQQQSHPPGMFNNINFGGGLGQSTNQQTVPGVRIDITNLRGTTRFNDLHEDLQKQISDMDNVIQGQIRLKHQCDAIMPSHENQLSSIPNDFEFCRRKLIGVQDAVETDATSISVARDFVKKDAEHAKLSFRAIDNLKLPPQYHNSGIWASKSTNDNQSQRNGDGDAQDLVGFFSETSNEMSATLEKYQKNFAELELYLRGVEYSSAQQINALLAKGNGGASRQEDPIQELAAALVEFEQSVLGVAGKVGGVREEMLKLQLGPLVDNTRGTSTNRRNGIY